MIEDVLKLGSLIIIMVNSRLVGVVGLGFITCEDIGEECLFLDFFVCAWIPFMESSNILVAVFLMILIPLLNHISIILTLNSLLKTSSVFNGR